MSGFEINKANSKLSFLAILMIGTLLSSGPVLADPPLLSGAVSLNVTGDESEEEIARRLAAANASSTDAVPDQVDANENVVPSAADTTPKQLPFFGPENNPNADPTSLNGTSNKPDIFGNWMASNFGNGVLNGQSPAPKNENKPYSPDTHSKGASPVDNSRFVALNGQSPAPINGTDFSVQGTSPVDNSGFTAFKGQSPAHTNGTKPYSSDSFAQKVLPIIDASSSAHKDNPQRTDQNARAMYHNKVASSVPTDPNTIIIPPYNEPSKKHEDRSKGLVPSDFYTLKVQHDVNGQSVSLNPDYKSNNDHANSQKVATNTGQVFIQPISPVGIPDLPGVEPQSSAHRNNTDSSNQQPQGVYHDYGPPNTGAMHTDSTNSYDPNAYPQGTTPNSVHVNNNANNAYDPNAYPQGTPPLNSQDSIFTVSGSNSVPPMMDAARQNDPMMEVVQNIENHQNNINAEQNTVNEPAAKVVVNDDMNKVVMPDQAKVAILSNDNVKETNFQTLYIAAQVMNKPIEKKIIKSREAVVNNKKSAKSSKNKARKNNKSAKVVSEVIVQRSQPVLSSSNLPVLSPSNLMDNKNPNVPLVNLFNEALNK